MKCKGTRKVGNMEEKYEVETSKMSFKDFIAAVTEECRNDGMNMVRVKRFLKTEDGISYLRETYRDHCNVNAMAYIIYLEA